uniref:Uncharacterized protein n=1 Tax=Angiostrongylus cantonensis TaxID=6313 RepID=A0A0K0DKG0_ANGCA
MNQVHGQQARVDKNAYAAESSTAACPEAQLFSGVIDGFEWVPSPRLGQADNVVSYPSCLHEQVFYRGFGCKCTCIVDTDRHLSSLQSR